MEHEKQTIGWAIIEQLGHKKLDAQEACARRRRPRRRRAVLMADEPRRWTLIDQSENFTPRWTITNQDRSPVAREYAERVEVMPVAEHEDVVGGMVSADWHGLMAILDEHYPADVFTGESLDVGARLVVALRQVNRLRTAVERIRDYDSFQGGPIAPRATPTECALRSIAKEALSDG